MVQGRLAAGAVRHGRARRRLVVALLASSSALAILAAAPVARAQAIAVPPNVQNITIAPGSTKTSISIANNGTVGTPVTPVAINVQGGATLPGGITNGGLITATAVISGAAITPYVNLDYVHQHVGAFTESGSFGAFSVAPANGQSLTTTLGLRASTSIDLGDHGTLVPEVRVGWQHEFLDASQTLTAQLAGSAASPFTVVGTSFGRDSAVVGVGVSHEFAPGASFFVDYDGQFTGGFNQNSGSVGIKVRF